MRKKHSSEIKGTALTESTKVSLEILLNNFDFVIAPVADDFDGNLCSIVCQVYFKEKG